MTDTSPRFAAWQSRQRDADPRRASDLLSAEERDFLLDEVRRLSTVTARLARALDAYTHDFITPAELLAGRQPGADEYVPGARCGLCHRHRAADAHRTARVVLHEAQPRIGYDEAPRAVPASAEVREQDRRVGWGPI
jgi:hypothetical protein